MNRVALIDGDELCYKTSLQFQQKYYSVLREDRVISKFKLKQEAIEFIGNNQDLDIGEEIEVLDPTGFKNRLDSDISRILNDTSSSNYIYCLSSENNIRYEIATLQPYKGNRVSDKPFHYPLIEGEIKSRGSISIDRLEADDVMSILNNEIDILHQWGQSKEAVICSSDKDLRTVPSLNYNITKGELKFIIEDDAEFNFFYQLLIGDDVDYIPHPWLLGEVKALNFLKELYGQPKCNYIKEIIPFYSKFLLTKNANGTYKTSWYDGRSVEEVLWEIGNLLWMHRTRDLGERWELYD